MRQALVAILVLVYSSAGWACDNSRCNEKCNPEKQDCRR